MRIPWGREVARNLPRFLWGEGHRATPNSSGDEDRERGRSRGRGRAWGGTTAVRFLALLLLALCLRVGLSLSYGNASGSAAGDDAETGQWGAVRTPQFRAEAESRTPGGDTEMEEEWAVGGDTRQLEEHSGAGKGDGTRPGAGGSPGTAEGRHGSSRAEAQSAQKEGPGRRFLTDESEGEAEGEGPVGRLRVRGLWGMRTRRRRPRRRTRDPSQCWSRSERRLYHTVEPSRPSPGFKAALLQYAEMHAACTSGVKDWTRFYMSDHSRHSSEVGRAGSAPAHCKFLLWMPPLYAGLGNRILSLVSTFLYAMLTSRALLVGPSEVLAQIICNPFEDAGATWMTSSSGFRTMYQNIKDWQPKAADFAERVRNGTVWDRRAAYVDLKYTAGTSEWQFFCPSVQEKLQEAKFIGLHTEEYTVPGYYLVPSFQERLRSWFPDNRPFMHSARFLVHPVNYIWQRITRSFHAYLSHSQRRVGIQVRTFYKQDRPTRARVMECAVNVSRVLPPLFSSPLDWQAALAKGSPEGTGALLRSPLGKSTVAMVASLGDYHFKHLQAAYAQRETADGTLVALHSEGHEGEELVGNQGQYERAMQEMWLLSFSHDLLVSDASSFGYVAAGLGGIRPHSMNICFRPKIGLDWYTNRRPVCALAASSEPCYLAPPGSVQCPGQFKGLHPMEPSHGLQQCSSITMGLELATP